jgi:hypothetical protein
MNIRMAAAVATVSLLGCQSVSSSTAAPEPALLTTTHVQVAPDGTYEESVVHETLADRLERIARVRDDGAAHPNAVQDTACGGEFTEAILCDLGLDYHGACTGNQACFYGHGPIALSSVSRGAGGNWAGHVLWTEGNSWNGKIYKPGIRGGCSQSFSTGGWTYNQSCWAATYLNLCNPDGYVCNAASDCCSGYCNNNWSCAPPPPPGSY